RRVSQAGEPPKRVAARAGVILRCGDVQVSVVEALGCQILGRGLERVGREAVLVGAVLKDFLQNEVVCCGAAAEQLRREVRGGGGGVGDPDPDHDGGESLGVGVLAGWVRFEGRDAEIVEFGGFARLLDEVRVGLGEEGLELEWEDDEEEENGGSSSHLME
ncbi:LOW QUALITY PROTEIN: hypothetical protein TorRG33x02_219790, partial [Trema orientale]